MSLDTRPPSRPVRTMCREEHTAPVTWRITYLTDGQQQGSLLVNVHAGPLGAEGAALVLGRSIPGAQLVSFAAVPGSAAAPSVADAIDGSAQRLMGGRDVSWASGVALCVLVAGLIATGTWVATHQGEIWAWVCGALGGGQ